MDITEQLHSSSCPTYFTSLRRLSYAGNKVHLPSLGFSCPSPRQGELLCAHIPDSFPGRLLGKLGPFHHCPLQQTENKSELDKE